jgi:hypothetical protein
VGRAGYTIPNFRAEQKKPARILSTEMYLFCLSVCAKDLGKLNIIAGKTEEARMNIQRRNVPILSVCQWEGPG